MALLFEIFFWLSVFGIAFSYLIYPVILDFKSRRKLPEWKTFAGEKKWPDVYILMAVYNEEKVIQKKLESIISAHYPYGNVHFYIGSDCSTDKTNKIIESYQASNPNLHFFVMDQRSGKSGILNFLHELINKNKAVSKDDVYILTDANVIFDKYTVYELAKHFKDEKMGVVNANILNITPNRRGIAQEEKTYIQRENRIKYMEGINWNATIGAFGACYALRAGIFEKIPVNFLMEDFYLSMKALEKGYKSITDLNAQVTEDVSEDVKQEFKRKIRISAGNYQNLNRFRHLLHPNKKGIAFAFFSHKVLRWLTPFLIIFSLIFSGILGTVSDFYSYIFWIQSALIVLSLIDYFLQLLRIKIPGIRLISYFYMMNLALLIGFFKYLKGIKTNVWQPTTRTN